MPSPRPESPPLAHHVILRRVDDGPLASTPAEWRAAARCFLSAGRDARLLTFRVADTHAHALVACSRTDSGRFAARVAIALRRRLHLPAGFEPTRHRPVRDRRHLERAVHYILRQEDHHGLRLDPSHDGSNLPDLVGMRLVGAFTRSLVAALLPRLDPMQWLDELPTPMALDLLVDAATAASAIPHLRGNDGATVAARTAAVHVASEHHRAGAIADELGVCRRSVTRLASASCDPALVRAVALQARWRTSLRTRHEGRRAGS